MGAAATLAAGIVLTGLLATGLGAYAHFEKQVTGDRHEFFEALPLRPFLLFEQSYRPHIAVKPRLGSDGYPVYPRNGQAIPTLKEKKNIVIFLCDGLRADYVGPDLTPNMVAFRDRYSVIAPVRHYSTSHFTEQGVFGLLYGLYAYHYMAFMKAKVSPFPIEMLKRNGYRTEFINGSGFNKYPTDYLAEIFDVTHLPHSDDEVLATFREVLDKRSKDGQPYLIVVFFYAPHYPFPAKKSFQRYRPVSKGGKQGGSIEYRQTLNNRYRNSILQADDYFRQVFECIKDDFEGGRTIFLATADHGTEIYDHGLFGQGKVTFWNEKVMVPFFLALPGLSLSEGERMPALSSHTDFWPTVIDYLQPDSLLEPEFYADGISLLHRSAPNARQRRKIFITGRYFPYAGRKNTIVDADRKYWFTIPGVNDDGTLRYDVSRVTDLDDNPVEGFFMAGDAQWNEASRDLDRRFWKFLRHTGRN